MSPKCKKYKDVYAAPASDLYKALEDKDNKKAEEVYKQAREAAKKFEDI
jgi:hypothetical protein